jgi:hypothetical protein
MKPGDTPDSNASAPKQEDLTPPQAAATQTSEVPTLPLVNAQSPAPEQPVPSAEEEATWYHAEDAPAPADGQAYIAPLDQPADVTWTASEYIAHEKPALWYVAFVFVAALIGVVIYFVTKEIIMVVAGLAALASFGIMASRHPRTLDYQLDDKGVHIAEKLYPYAGFKSYTLADIGSLRAIDLIPMERFKPSVTLYFPKEQEVAILNKLSVNLPFEERNLDTIERLMHRLRF